MSSSYRHGGEIYDKDVRLDYSVNLNPLGVPEAVKEALTADFSYITRYPDTECRALREALSAKYELPADMFLCGSGASELFQLIVKAVAPRKALVEAPTFSGYEKALADGGIIPDCYRLDRANGFALTDDFLKALDGRPDLVFLCQPNNPVGNIIDHSLLEKIAAACREKKICLVVDECFLELLPDCGELTAAAMISENPYLIVVNAFTKVYAMPGLRLGFLMTSNRELLAKMKAAQTEWSVSGAAQTAGLAALGEQDYVRDAVKLIREERAHLEAELTKRGFRVYPGEANYVLIEVPDRPPSQHKAEAGGQEPLSDGQAEAAPDLADRLLEKGILIRKCSNYHGLDGTFFRIAVRRREENRILIKTLDEVLDEEE